MISSGYQPPSAKVATQPSALLSFAEAKLAALGCVKINLQILGGNESAQAFYETMSYAVEERISMGKELRVAPRPR